MLTKVNLIVGTTNNYAPSAMSIKKAAQSLIKKGTVVTEGLAEHGRDGLPRLRSVLRLRHAFAAGTCRPGGDDARRERRGDQGAARMNAATTWWSASATPSLGTTGLAGAWRSK